MQQNELEGKEILITGATGTLGRELVRQLRVLPIHGLRIFSRDELKQYQFAKDLKGEPHGAPVDFLLGDVRDRDRLKRAMEGADIVINAAAMKQVPACEANPLEAVKTNVLGAVNVLEAALDAGVKKVMHISSDKCVYPLNLYGATKMVAEKLFIHGNVYSGRKETRFSVCRYGNVLGSRGSVVPLFLEQKKTGIVTVTDERMTRFWITVPVVAAFILHRIAEMQGGEVFIPRMPSMRVVDIARALAPEAQVKDIGIRFGEKIHETILSGEEVSHAVLRRGTQGDPEYWTVRIPKDAALNHGTPVTSENNEKWLSSEELLRLLEGSEHALCK